MDLIGPGLKPISIAIGLFLLFSLLFFAIISDYAKTPDLAKDSVYKERILIISPHPDDESLAAAGIIKKAVEKNQSVLVVEVTDGSGSINSSKLRQYHMEHNSSGSLVEIRKKEAIQAMKSLGLNNSAVIFLGYPDGGINHMFNDNWGLDEPYKSNNEFNQLDFSPYNFTYHHNASYSGECLAQDLRKIIHDFQPTSIYYPDMGDEHKDHRATSAFVMYAAAENNYTGNNYTYLIHKSRKWPSPPIYMPLLDLSPPDQLRNLDGVWVKSNLTANEQWAKEVAVDWYDTQIFNTKGYIKSYIRRNELFAVYPEITISKVSNNYTGDQMPESIFQDVRVNQKNQELQPPTNFTSLGMAYNNKHAILIIKTPEINDKNTIIHFHLRIYDQNFERIDIKVQNQSAKYENKALNSIIPKNNPEIQYHNQTMIVKIPLDTIKNSKKILLSADIKDVNEYLIFQMPWREMTLPNR
jgi:LmbE family N-acetylglucosaminyl deacetylase